MPAKSLELKHTIKLIQVLDSEITDIEIGIKSIMDGIGFPILTISGISYRMGAMILSGIGDFSKFDSPERYSPMLDYFRIPHQSGQLESSYSHMKKRAECKHYNVAVSQVAKNWFE